MDLGQLIADSKRRSARTYAQIAKDCGGDPSDKRLQQFVTQRIEEFPKAKTIRALAVGLKVSETTVVLAAAQSVGLRVQDAPSLLIEMLPPRADMLTDDEAASVAQLVRSITGGRQPAPDSAREAEALRVAQKAAANATRKGEKKKARSDTA